MCDNSIQLCSTCALLNLGFQIRLTNKLFKNKKLLFWKRDSFGLLQYVVQIKQNGDNTLNQILFLDMSYFQTIFRLGHRVSLTTTLEFPAVLLLHIVPRETAAKNVWNTKKSKFRVS